MQLVSDGEIGAVEAKTKNYVARYLASIGTVYLTQFGLYVISNASGVYLRPASEYIISK